MDHGRRLDKKRSSYFLRAASYGRARLVAVLLLCVPSIAWAQDGVEGAGDASVPPDPPRASDTGDSEFIPEPEPPERVRHFALSVGITPAIACDYEHGYLHAFGAFNLLWPIESSGKSLPYLLMALGVGTTLPLGTTSRWRFELFGAVTPARVDSRGWKFGVGVGLGFHYTFPGGFTFGFKLPLIGYSLSTQPPGDGELHALPAYYLEALMAYPLLNLGYRF